MVKSMGRYWIKKYKFPTVNQYYKINWRDYGKIYE